MKTCYICEVPKILDEFYKDKHSDDGRTSGCKQCLKKKAAEIYSGIKDTLSDHRKALRKAAYERWKEKNPEKYKESYQKLNKKIKK